MSQRLQLENYYSGEEMEKKQFAEDRYFYMAIFGGVFAFFIITYPYRDISIPSPILALGAFVVMCGLMASSYLRPEYYWASIAFCIYIPFSGEYEGDFGQTMMGMNFTNVLIMPILLQWFMQRTYMRESLVSFHAPDVPLLCFCILSSISVLQLGVQEGGANIFVEQFIRIKRWLFPFLIYFLFVNTKRNEKGVKYVMVSICTAVTAVAILTMKESYDIGPAGSWDKIRVRGVLGAPNSTGAFFVYYTLPFLGFFLCYWRNRFAWLLLIPFMLSGRAMTLANSRGGIIAMTLAILATLFVRSRILFAVGLTIVILGYHFPEYLPETISGRLFSTVRHVDTEQVQVDFIPNDDSLLARLEGSAQGRLLIWSAGIRMVLDKPLMGHGYGSFPRLIGWYGNVQGGYDRLIAQRDPHNTYLGIAAEMGLIALGFFLLTLFLILRSCFSIYYRAPDLFMRALGLASIGMMMGMLSANFFGSRMDTTELTAYFWIISAIVVQYDKDLRKRLSQEYSPDVLVADPWKRDEEEELL